MSIVHTTDPRTGQSTATRLTETTADAVDAAVAGAVEDTATLQGAGRAARAELLESIMARVLASRDELVDLAVNETGLAVPRLEGEVDRAAHQFGLFAEVLRDGAYVEAMIDHADGAAPDVRRMLVALGPVAVFGASNFPFAFSVLGGDTASAIAAGCGVVAKAHPAHPLTSALSASIVEAAARESVGVAALRVVFGFDAGLNVVRQPQIRAVTLTGSVSAARGILDVIAEREEPIPFFGELSSLNPLAVLPGAARDRAEDIAAGIFASFTASGGQLCTKPNLAFIPRTEAGDRIVEALRVEVDAAPGVALLSDGIRENFLQGVRRQIRSGAVRLAPLRPSPPEQGFVVRPELLETDTDALEPALAEECFGPVVTLVRYRSAAELVRQVGELPRSLTVSIHAGPEDQADVAALLLAAGERTGRVVFDGYPTGVRVSWAQHHGGPWPSTNSQHTSVGATAIRRFLRPIAFQNAPGWALPAELQDGQVDIPRRVDGVMTG